MPKTAFAELIDATEALSDEELNNYVDWLRVHLKNRAASRNAKARASMKVGDRVMFIGNLKPQYLQGLTGVVEEKKQSRILVKLDRGPVGKFKSGKILANPGSLEVLS